MTACMTFKTVSLGLSRCHARLARRVGGWLSLRVPRAGSAGIVGVGPAVVCDQLSASRSPLRPDLEWRLTYVGSAESEKYDQVLDMVYVGPVAPGQYRFVFQVRAWAGGDPATDVGGTG